MRRPTEDEWWLFLGYVVWFCFVYSLWRLGAYVLRHQ